MPDNVVAFVNDKVVRQACDFCIGINDSQKAFFAKRFGERLPGSPFDVMPPPTAEELAAMASEVDYDLLSNMAGKQSPPPLITS
jgi:hypothetical protein